MPHLRLFSDLLLLDGFRFCLPLLHLVPKVAAHNVHMAGRAGRCERSMYMAGLGARKMMARQYYTGQALLNSLSALLCKSQ
eukprot:scaffold123405_cov22-Tisochrysis_lutea.AAC.1